MVDCRDWREAEYKAAMAAERTARARTVFSARFASTSGNSPIPETVATATSNGRVAIYFIVPPLSSPGKLIGSFRQVSLARWFGSSLVHMVSVLCLLILSWIVDPSLADPVSYSQFSQLETRPLRLGLKRTNEKLPFRGGEGKCVYELMNMKEAHWYEVKISYPASTPAIFGIDLLPEHTEDAVSSGRKLLNTEKIIFHLPKGSGAQDKRVGMTRRVLVSVKPEGFVALPFVEEQEFIIYSIFLEEVVLGIPLQAFWVGFLGLAALGISVLAAQQISTRLQPLPGQLTPKSTKRVV